MNCFDKSQYIELNIKINSREDVSSLELLLYDHFGLRRRFFVSPQLSKFTNL